MLEESRLVTTNGPNQAIYRQLASIGNDNWVLGRNRSDNLKLALTEFQKLLLLLVVEDLAKFNIKIFGFSEPDKSLIYSSTSLIERTDQTSSIAGQLWIWRELDESSRHLHKLFILPYFTATSLSIIFIFRRRRHYCTAFKLF